MLGAVRLFPGRVRILRRAHGWVRDGFITVCEQAAGGCELRVFMLTD